MSGPVDRDLVEQLLQDQSLSYREIGRRAQCSDWTVRRVARELAGESVAPQRSRRNVYSQSAHDASPVAWWVTPLLLLGGVAFVVVLAARGGGNR